MMVIKMTPIVAAPKAYEAIFKLDLISAVGTAILISTLLSMVLLRFSLGNGLRALRDTVLELRRPVLSIGLVLAFAFVANY
jgi:lactate permease